MCHVTTTSLLQRHYLQVHKLDALERVCAARLFVQASPREYKSCDLLDGSVSEKTNVCMEPLHVSTACQLLLLLYDYT
jgi:hypothetical protein